MKGEPSHRASPPDDDPPAPGLVKQQMLERDNAELRQRVRSLEVPYDVSRERCSPMLPTARDER